MKTYFVKNKKGNLFLEYNSIIQEIQNKKDNIETRLSKIKLPESKEVMSKEEQENYLEYKNLTIKDNYIKTFLIPFFNKIPNDYQLKILKYYWNEGNLRTIEENYKTSTEYKKIKKQINIESYFIFFIFASFLSLLGIGFVSIERSMFTNFSESNLLPNFIQKLFYDFYESRPEYIIETAIPLYLTSIITVIISYSSMVFLYHRTNNVLFLIIIFSCTFIKMAYFFIYGWFMIIPILLFFGVILIPIDILLGVFVCGLYRSLMCLDRLNCCNNNEILFFTTGFVSSILIGKSIKESCSGI